MMAISKRSFDLLVAVPLIVILAPILVIIATAIKLDSPGTIFFRQRRLGLDTAPFTMLKFRTMVSGAETMKEGIFNYEDDPRVTRVGRHLRAWSLDELPQLFNVLGGAMSLVGPRPPITYELGDVASFDSELRDRFRVKPGITGLAQVSGRNALSWDQKIQLDNEYVSKWNRLGVLYDLYILIRTPLTIFSKSGDYELASNRKSDMNRQQ